MADEGTDVPSKEELSVCAHWLNDHKSVEHFHGIIPAKETNAQAITEYLYNFLGSKSIGFEKMRGLGFDGANTISGKNCGLQIHMRLHTPNTHFVRCQSHKIQLTAIDAAKEHIDVKHVLGTLLATWSSLFPQKRPKKFLKCKLFLIFLKLRCKSPVIPVG